MILGSETRKVEHTATISIGDKKAGPCSQFAVSRNFTLTVFHRATVPPWFKKVRSSQFAVCRNLTFTVFHRATVPPWFKKKFAVLLNNAMQLKCATQQCFMPVLSPVHNSHLRVYSEKIIL
jgi:hypothetical protein